MKKYICDYIINGEEKSEIFDTLDEGLNFCERLDKMIEKGKCVGYDFSSIRTGNI